MSGSESAKDRIGIVLYGVGNVTSVVRAVERAGAVPVLIERPGDLESAGSLILPGVGAFGEAAMSMEVSGMADAIKDFAQSGSLVLGICLGMQLLFDSSEESPGARGLGLIKGGSKLLGGDDLRFGACDIRLKGKAKFKVPHTGWNEVRFKSAWPLGGMGEGKFYFTHSYQVVPKDQSVVAGTTSLAGDGGDEGRPMVSAVVQENVMGVQFHPEKSAEAGLGLIRRFAEKAAGLQ